MKAHLTKVSLALLSAAFLFGCQEQGSEPVGPEGLEIQAKRGSDKGKGDGSNTLAELTISGGMEGPVLKSGEPKIQLVSFGDGKNQFKIQAHDNAIGNLIKLAMNLDPVTPCEEGGTGTGNDDEIIALRAALLSKLNDGNLVERRQLFITVGKDDDQSDDNKIGVSWDEGGRSFHMVLRPNTVSTVGKFEKDGSLEFTFQGGSVKLRDITEKRPKDRIRVTCSLANAPDIVMVLTPA